VSLKEALDVFVKYLKSERRYSSNTVQAYRADLEQLFEFLSDSVHEERQVLLEEVGRDDLRWYLSSLVRHGLSKRTAARKLASIRAFFRHLVRMEIVKTNPASSLVSPRTDKTLPEFLQEDEIRDALESIDRKPVTGVRDRAVVELFYGTGMRLSELVGLNLRDVDFMAGTVRVLGKGNKERIIPLGKNTGKVIKGYLARRHEFCPEAVEQALFLTESCAKMLEPGFGKEKIESSPTEAYICYTSSGSWCGPAGSKRIIGTRESVNNSDIHTFNYGSS